MAITKETFRIIIHEGQEEIRDVELYERSFEFEENGRYVLVGVRQAGKSYMLYKRAKQLMADNHHLEEIVYINFDDERLLGMTASDFDLILQAYASVYTTNHCFSSMKYKILTDGNTLHDGLPIKNIWCL